MTHNEYLTLIEEVNRFRNQINLFNEDEISESALDDLKHKVTLFEQANPSLISPNSPNFTISGGVAEGFEKVAHYNRMLSLTDVFDLEELLDWEKKFRNYATKEEIPLPEELDYYAEPKIDGLALSIIYENGTILQAATRGDGLVGENVTKNILQIASIPKLIPETRKLEVRGEVFLSKSDFKQLNLDILNGIKKGKAGGYGELAQFANPRNAASGTLRQLDSNVVAERNLSFIAYYLNYLD
jgi:DNA ligase (NAD+)